MSETIDRPMNPLTGQAVTDQELSSVTELAIQAMGIQDEINKLAADLERKKSDLLTITDFRIPDAMSEIGLEDFTLKSGTRISVKPFYSAKIPDEHKPAAFKWLADNHHDSIIKAEVSVTFGKGERSRADEVMKLLAKQGHIPVKSEGVHPMTLKAFVKEQIEGGQALPQDLFGVYVGKRAKFTEPKK